jgi:hypothetical protein
MLGFIDADQSIMVEYGYLHGDAATALFRSRFTADELRRQARDRAEEGAAILGRYRDQAQYGEFLGIYTPVTDPFLHEAKVHLYSRDINLEWARSNAQADERRRQFTKAYRANRILEDYFGELVHASGYAWPTYLEAEIREKIDPDWVYNSKVSQDLITTFSRRQVFWFFLGAAIGLWLLGNWFGRRVRD